MLSLQLRLLRLSTVQQATPVQGFLAKPLVGAMEFVASPPPMAMVFMAIALEAEVLLGSAKRSLGLAAKARVVLAYLAKAPPTLAFLERAPAASAFRASPRLTTVVMAIALPGEASRGSAKLSLGGNGNRRGDPSWPLHVERNGNYLVLTGTTSQTLTITGANVDMLILKGDEDHVQQKREP